MALSKSGDQIGKMCLYKITTVTKNCGPASSLVIFVKWIDLNTATGKNTLTDLITQRHLVPTFHFHARIKLDSKSRRFLYFSS